MQQQALDHAKARFLKAKSSFDLLHQSESLHEFRSHWTDFLTAANTVYSKLEQGAKSSDKSMNWYGRKKSERKKDPLLSYLHHARNADEHCVVESTALVGKSITLKVPGSTASFDGKQDDDGVNRWHTSVVSPDGSPISSDLGGGHYILFPVVDRGVKYVPPKSHLNDPLLSEDATEVASLCIRNLTSLLSEAEKLDA